MTALYRLVYTSKNLMDVPEAEMLKAVEQILGASQRNNARCDVTGALLFNSGAFAQVLEGPQSGVEATFERIQRDVRHADVTVLQCGPAEERAFKNWSMAFVGHSAKGQALWNGLAARSGFDLSRLDGDEVFTMLHDLVLDEEPIPSKAVSAVEGFRPQPAAFDPDEVRAEIDRLRPRRPERAETAQQTRSAARTMRFGRVETQTRASTPSPTSDTDALPVLRAAILAERRRITDLRAELDDARIAAARSLREAVEMRAQRDLWADRARLMASLIGEEAVELTRLATVRDEAA